MSPSKLTRDTPIEAMWTLFGVPVETMVEAGITTLGEAWDKIDYPQGLKGFVYHYFSTKYADYVAAIEPARIIYEAATAPERKICDAACDAIRNTYEFADDEAWREYSIEVAPPRARFETACIPARIAFCAAIRAAFDPFAEDAA